MTVGDIVAFQSLVSSFTRATDGLVGFADRSAVKGDVARLDDVNSYPLEPRLADTAEVTGTRDGDPALSGGKLGGAIEMRRSVLATVLWGPPLSKTSI